MKITDTVPLAEILVEAYAALPERWSLATAARHIQENFSAKVSFTAQSGTKILGGIVAGITAGDLGPELYIDDILVRADHRGQGLGRKLYLRAVTQARRLNLTSIRLQASPSLRSYQWYVKLGFQETTWVELHYRL